MWRPSVPLSSPRAAAALTACNGRLYVIGGSFDHPLLFSPF